METKETLNSKDYRGEKKELKTWVLVPQNLSGNFPEQHVQADEVCFSADYIGLYIDKVLIGRFTNSWSFYLLQK